MAQPLVERSVPRLNHPLETHVDPSSRPRSQSILDGALSPVNTAGCFEFDRVIKCGYVQKRTQKTKKWKSVYMVLRPSALSLYKSDKEDRLRHQIYLSDLTAVADLKDPKHKRENVFGLFSPSRNYHFQASTAQDAQQWVELIRRDARIDEEHEMYLTGPCNQSRPSAVGNSISFNGSTDRIGDQERFLSSSPEPIPSPNHKYATSGKRRRSSVLEYSGLSGNELASHSDMSDNEGLRLPGPSVESLAVKAPLEPTSLSRSEPQRGPGLPVRSSSQTSVSNLDQDPDRIIWQGWLYFLRSKRGVRQWKDLWAVLRPRNLILYKDESEYTAQLILPLSTIVDVVDIDPISRSKRHCLQVITEEKSYKFGAHDEESLVQCLGAFKSLLAKRRELEARVAAANATAAASGHTSSCSS